MVASILGWKGIKSHAYGMYFGMSPGPRRRMGATLPDWPNDLNACADMEKVAIYPKPYTKEKGKLFLRYLQTLADIVHVQSLKSDNDEAGSIAFASARQRCEALILVHLKD